MSEKKPTIDQVLAWKKAVADRNRDQRNRRGRRPGPQITGIRVPAPKDAS